MDTLLAQVAQSVAGARDLESLTRSLLEMLETITGMESTYLTRIDEAGGVQHIVYSRNTRQLKIPEGLAVPWGDTLCKRALDEGQPYTDDVAACWGDSDAARQLGIRTYLSQPVRYLDGELYGTLCAASSASVPVTPATVKILDMFARLIAQQIERERLLAHLQEANAELSAHALTDPLTGLANRRALMLELSRMLARAQREGFGLLVAFIDLNGFKAINDRHGHDVGDRFLIHIARRLKDGLRAGDLLARYGGDEFVVATVGESPEELRTRLVALTAGRFESGDVALDYAGASVGVIAPQPGETDADKVITRADASMYAMKMAHRAAHPR